jgi:signal transduction histidine kinase/ActR/RegA family two-component response regulator
LITYFNPKAVELWGRAPKLNDPADRFCGSFKLFSSDGTPIRHDQCWMALALQTNKEFNGREVLVERPDGRRLTVLAHANPIRDETGELQGAVNVLVDISDRKRMEEALRDADRTKDEFLATLAHELRNPLAPIRNAVQVLHLRESPEPESRWALEVIDRQMQHMTRLIDDLLDLSRITRNKLELRKERVELADVVRAALETSRPLMETAHHRLVVELPKEPIFLKADSTRLAQAISNLLNNAAKYTESHGQVWLTAERQGSDAVVRVRDSGMGISADMLPRVFDMFLQIDPEPERAQKGLGIGLTLVKRLIEMHGGSIEALSEGPGKGSEFIIRLPALIEPKLPAGSQPAVQRKRSTPSALRILVVDDNRDAAATLSMLLRIIGNEVRTAYNGLEGFTLAGEFRPQVVLLDLGLPGMNGYQVARKIRQQEWGKGMILIAVTGWGQERDRQTARESGFDHHMVKPVDPSKLMELLASLEETVSAHAAQADLSAHVA